MTIWRAYKLFWKNYFNFNGKATRKEYWFVQVLNLLILIFLLILSSYSYLEVVAFGEVLNTILLATSVLYIFVNIIPLASLTCRRFSDAGFSKIWCIAGWSVILIIKCIGDSNFLLIISDIINMLMRLVMLLPSDDRS